MVVGSTAAGSSDEQLIETVAGRLARRGPTEVVITSAPDDLDRVLRDHRGRTVVVVGGDGSVHVAVNALDRTGLLEEVTLGFVPLGTANDFSTALGMADDPAAAADQLADGRTSTVDLLRLHPASGEPELIANAVHAGLGIAAADRATPLKRWLGPAAYPVGALWAGVRYPGREVTVGIDGADLDLDGPVLAVAVANARRLGGVRFVPDADPTDGLLDLLVVPARPWRARGAMVAHLAGRDPAHVRLERGRSVTLAGDLGPVDADGEQLDVGVSCRIEVLPKALSIRAPVDRSDTIRPSWDRRGDGYAPGTGRPRPPGALSSAG